MICDESFLIESRERLVTSKVKPGARFRGASHGLVHGVLPMRYHPGRKTSQRSPFDISINPSRPNPQSLAPVPHIASDVSMSPIIDIHLPSPSTKKTHGRQTSYQRACRAKLFISRASHSARSAGNTPLFGSRGGGRGWLCYFLMKKKSGSCKDFRRFVVAVGANHEQSSLEGYSKCTTWRVACGNHSVRASLLLLLNVNKILLILTSSRIQVFGFFIHSSWFTLHFWGI